MSGYDGTPIHEQRLRAERDAAVERYEKLRRAVNESSGECTDDCDSYAHSDDCTQCDFAHEIVVLRDQRDAAVAEAAELRAKLEEHERCDDFIRRELMGMECGNGVQHDDLRSEASGECVYCIIAEARSVTGPAIDALHAAGILTFGTLAQGVEKLAGERDAAKDRARRAAQILIAEIGAPGPESVVETAERAVANLAEARAALSKSDDNALRDAIDHILCRVHPDGAEAIEAFWEWMEGQEGRWLHTARAAGCWLYGELNGDPSPRDHALSGKTCAKCEETELALERLSSWASHDPRYPGEKADVRLWLKRCGLWRDPAPARADESGGGC